MGLMQLFRDQTYRDLVEHTVRFTAGRGEVLAGVGDTSFVRTRDRIRIIEQFDIDGVVVLSPYLFPFLPQEQIDYYKALADVSSKPVSLYNLPGITGVNLAIDTVLEVARHPNIAGIKCSCEFEWTRSLMNLIDDDQFRIVAASPDSVDLLIKAGVREHLDGVFGLAPHWTVAIAEAAGRGDWKQAAAYQGRRGAFLRLVREKYPVHATFTAILNARGIQGNCAPMPMQPLTGEQSQQLLTRTCGAGTAEQRRQMCCRGRTGGVGGESRGRGLSWRALFAGATSAG